MVSKTYRSPRAVLPNHNSNNNSIDIISPECGGFRLISIDCRWRLIKSFLLLSGVGLCCTTILLHGLMEAEDGELGMMVGNGDMIGARMMDPSWIHHIQRQTDMQADQLIAARIANHTDNTENKNVSKEDGDVVRKDDDEFGKGDPEKDPKNIVYNEKPHDDHSQDEAKKPNNIDNHNIDNSNNGGHYQDDAKNLNNIDNNNNDDNKNNNIPPPKPITIEDLHNRIPPPRPTTPLRNNGGERFPNNSNNNNNNPLTTDSTTTMTNALPPALNGAQRGTIQCDVDVDFLAYWNDPVGTYDQTAQSPFGKEDPDKTQYVSFEFDKGGWNNIRISMESIVVFAAATGRTLVLPPNIPIYLLDKRKSDGKSRASLNFNDFFVLDSPAFKQYANLPILTFPEFLAKEGVAENVRGADGGPLAFLDDDEADAVERSKASCTQRKLNDDACEPVTNYQRRVGYIINGTQVTDHDFSALHHCFILDEEVLDNSDAYTVPKNFAEVSDASRRKRMELFCGERSPVFYSKGMQNADVIHFPTKENGYRFLNHFYSFLHFSNPQLDNHFKRFVRDFLHYRDEIYCAAGKIVLALQMESERQQQGGGDTGGGDLNQGDMDAEVGGHAGYSSFHIRRGDFQFKRVKISAEEWYDNTHDVFGASSETTTMTTTEIQPMMYIATDERDKSFFNPMADRYQLRYLDDYWKIAGLDNVDPNYMGMIDTIVASRGRIFVGTWMSTFTAYINRMRGYNGISMDKSFYGTLDQKEALHEPIYFPTGNYAAREFSIGWIGIDGDEFAGGGEDVRKALEEEGIQPQQQQPPPQTIEDSAKRSPLARGVSGLPEDQTPSLVGAQRGHIQCDGVDVDRLAYWNFPQGTRDIKFKSPFIGKKSPLEKYVSFQPDRGGWNNIRMSLETIFIFAVATNRTLVLPPDVPLYLLKADKGRKHRGFGDFFPLTKDWFKEGLRIISMEQFVVRELIGDGAGRFPIPDPLLKNIHLSAVACDNMKKSDIFCGEIWSWLETVGTVPEISGKECMIFDEDKFEGNDLSSEAEKKIKRLCAWSEKPNIFFDSTMQDNPLIHFSADKEHRMLAHFYGILHFTNSKIDNFMKRFVRDYMHYHDEIYCAAGKIVIALQEEGQARGFELDSERGGGYSSMHIRRGDLQYKKVKISAEEWYDNLHDTWQSKEIIYIATDERNKTFFDPIAKEHDVKFLDDYWDMAGLGDLDPNYFGMIDTIVASRGRVFGGTFFSTFSGYINRMRGYHGMSMNNSYYGWLPRKFINHEWDDEKSKGTTFGYEWPSGWIGIDGDAIQSNKTF